MDGIITRNRTWNDVVEEHYVKNFNRLVNRLQFPAGSIHAAEDILHDAYERALKYASSFSGEKFDRWFHTIIKNALRDYKKAEKGITDSVEVDEYDHVGAHCEGYSNKIWEELEELISRKSEDHSEVLRLYFYQGYTYKDISNVTNNTYFNAYRIVERFKEELVKRYKE